MLKEKKVEAEVEEEKVGVDPMLVGYNKLQSAVNLVIEKLQYLGIDIAGKRIIISDGKLTVE